MGPHPEVPVDVQKYIGSYLITQQPRSKRKSCTRNAVEKDGRCGGYSGVSSPVPICNCCGGVQISKVPSYPNLNNYAWTGVPLISVAGARQKSSGNNSKHRSVPRIAKPPQRDRLVEYSTHSESPECTLANGNIVGLEEILPISRLAIHAQGAPLIISGECEKAKDKESRKDVDGSMLKGQDIFLGNNSNMYMVVNSASVDMASSLYIHDDVASVSGESDFKSEPDLSRQTSPSQSDCVSTTSEDSGTSENGLPRIIKPRKRRKKDRRMSGGDKEQNDEGGGGAIVTLKPYQPLCYHYTNDSGKVLIPSKELNCDTFMDSPSSSPPSRILLSSSRYPYPSSHLCTCPHCVAPPLSLLTPPNSPVDTPMAEARRKGLPIYEVSAKIVTTPGGNRDLEIKFLSTSSSDDESSGLEELTSSDTDRIHTIGDSLILTASHPPQRPWVTISHPSQSHTSCAFTVMCYNVLCDKYATRQMYGYCPNWALEWNYRKKGIMDEIRHYAADIISLQEVETEQFYNFFLLELKKDGYDGIFSPKSRAKTMVESDRRHVDGCAIFYRTSKFFLIKKHLVEFNQLAMANAEGSDDMLNRVMTKDNIGLAALLQTRESAYKIGFPQSSQKSQILLVCTAHIHWDPEFSDVKLIQTMMLVHELHSIVNDILYSCRNSSIREQDANSIPLILCGDFNSLPESGVIEFLTSGRVAADHCDFKELGYKGCLSKLGCSARSNEFIHPFKIARAYEDHIMPFTNYSYDFKGIIDYVFYSKQHMKVLGVLGALDSEWFRDNKVSGCPHPHIPSDHFPILVELELSPTSSPYPTLPNGLKFHR